MNTAAILAGLKTAAATVDTFAPIAAGLGIPGAEAVGRIAGAAIDVAENVLKRAEEGKVVLTTQDRAQVWAILDRLRRENDLLAAKIANP